MSGSRTVRAPINDQLRQFVVDRMEKLQQLDMSAVHSLPKWTSEELPPDKKTEVIQYHDVLESGEHMVVVQVLRNRWFGLSTATEVDGFVMSTDGTKRPLKEEETWPYI